MTMTSETPEGREAGRLITELSQRVVFSQERTATMLDCSVWTVRKMVQRGDLKQIQLSARRVGITAQSILKLLEGRGCL